MVKKGAAKKEVKFKLLYAPRNDVENKYVLEPIVTKEVENDPALKKIMKKFSGPIKRKREAESVPKDYKMNEEDMPIVPTKVLLGSAAPHGKVFKQSDLQDGEYRVIDGECEDIDDEEFQAIVRGKEHPQGEEGEEDEEGEFDDDEDDFDEMEDDFVKKLTQVNKINVNDEDDNDQYEDDDEEEDLPKLKSGAKKPVAAPIAAATKPAKKTPVRDELDEDLDEEDLAPLKPVRKALRREPEVPKAAPSSRNNADSKKRKFDEDDDEDDDFEDDYDYDDEDDDDDGEDVRNRKLPAPRASKNDDKKSSKRKERNYEDELDDGFEDGEVIGDDYNDAQSHTYSISSTISKADQRRARMPLASSKEKMTLDEYFENFMNNKYGDDQIGDLEDDENIVGNATVAAFQKEIDEFANGTQDKWAELDMTEDEIKQVELVDPDRAAVIRWRQKNKNVPREEIVSVVKNYIQEYYKRQEEKAAAKKEKSKAAESGEQDEDDDDDDDDENGAEFVEIKQREKWDCESIVSTYSNLENHPTLIRDAAPRKKKQIVDQRKQIKISARTGLPVTVSASQKPAETPKPAPAKAAPAAPIKELTIEELKELKKKKKLEKESKEEKKARKNAVKEEKKAKREAKKALKQAFKEEEKAQSVIAAKPELQQRIVLKF